jgi:excisionase family DNA binding protein
MTERITIPQFAERIGVSRKTIEREIKRGNIKAVKQNPLAGRTSPLLIPISELVRWKKLQAKGAGKK